MSACLLVGMMVIPSSASSYTSLNQYSFDKYVKYSWYNGSSWVILNESWYSPSQSLSTSINFPATAKYTGRFDVVIPIDFSSATEVVYTAPYFTIDGGSMCAAWSYDWCNSCEIAFVSVTSNGTGAPSYSRLTTFNRSSSYFNSSTGVWTIPASAIPSGANGIYFYFNFAEPATRGRLYSIYTNSGDVLSVRYDNRSMVLTSANFTSTAINSTFYVSNVFSGERYTISASCYDSGSLVASAAVGPYLGPSFTANVPVSGLTPGTEYSVVYRLSEEGVDTGITQTITGVTLSAGTGDSGSSGDGSGSSGNCSCPSILNGVLSVLTSQTDFLATWKQVWTTRMDSFETTLSKLIPVPDPTETALKESVKDTTKEVTDSLFADDAPTKVTASDVKDVAQIGAAASSMFDFGVGVGSLFDVLNDLSFLSVFTQEMVDGMNTVSTPFIISDSDFDSAEYYYKNYEEVKEFVTGG